MIFGMFLGGGIVFAGFHYHLVITDDTWLIVPRENVTFEDAYVDLRAWKGTEWPQHGQLAKDLIASGHGEIVVDAASKSLIDKIFDPLADHLDE